LYRLTDENTPVNDPMMREMDELGKVIEAYEDIHYPIDKPSLATVLRLRMYEMGLNQKRLAELLHVSRSRISSYMAGKSEPTLKTARAIVQKLNIDASTVLGV
jgi:HTH-type transcriptional regulator/antitoxin HigA